MKSRMFAVLVAGVACAIGGPAVLSGCASASQAAREQARGDIRAFRSELVRMPAQIDRTVAALGDATSQATTNRSAAVSQLGTELARMQTHGRLLNQQADLAARNSKRYFQAWASELQASDDPADREQGKAALAAGQRNFNVAMQHLNNGRNEYRRFLNDLEQVHAGLANDSTDAGMNAVSSRVQSLIGQSVTLRNTVARMTEQIDRALANR